MASWQLDTTELRWSTALRCTAVVRTTRSIVSTSGGGPSSCFSSHCCTAGSGAASRPPAKNGMTSLSRLPPWTGPGAWKRSPSASTSSARMLAVAPGSDRVADATMCSRPSSCSRRNAAIASSAPPPAPASGFGGRRRGDSGPWWARPSSSRSPGPYG